MGECAGTGKDLSYVVEQCKSELNATWSVVMNTSAGHCTVSRLKPGASYRFRVRSLNRDGVAGPCSEDVIVHTMLETPTAPTPVPSTGIKARSITLQWKRRGDSYSMRDPATVSKLLADWAGKPRPRPFLAFLQTRSRPGSPPGSHQNLHFEQVAGRGEKARWGDYYKN